jgi:hypothetical protein
MPIPKTGLSGGGHDQRPPRKLFGLRKARVVTGTIGHLHCVGSRPKGKEMVARILDRHRNFRMRQTFLG